ncbi:hypothetical protein [Marinobacter sp. LN3S78]|uniref:hypothetical protein n=1 Tax=Marinobacter sp. LN3S78 TaxID=3382300 RepID=UPI00387B1E23
MNEQYLWPLAGVFLGWLLTVVSAAYRHRGNKEQLIGSLITKLIRVEHQIQLVVSACEGMKDFSDSWEAYESSRQDILQRYFMSPQSVSADLKSAIDKVAPFYPVLAIELEELYELLIKNKQNTLRESSKNQEAYIRMLSIYEVTLDVSQEKLQKYIRKLSLKHNILTYLQVRRIYRRKERSRATTSKSAEKLMSEIGKELKGSHNK